MALLYEELTGRILEACIEVSNELGAGFLESVYEKALLVALRQKGIEARAQVPMNVVFRDQVVGQFFADIVVEDKVVLELKAVKALSPEHQTQLINYLNATRMEVVCWSILADLNSSIKDYTAEEHTTKLSILSILYILV